MLHREQSYIVMTSYFSDFLSEGTWSRLHLADTPASLQLRISNHAVAGYFDEPIHDYSHLLSSRGTCNLRVGLDRHCTWSTLVALAIGGRHYLAMRRQ